MNPAYFFFGILFTGIILVSIQHDVLAQPTVERGKNYDKELISVNPDGSAFYKWVSVPDRIIKEYVNGKPVYADYILTDGTNSVKVETEHGSVILDKNTCTYQFYNSGYIEAGEKELFTDSILSKRATVGTMIWSEINQINNAQCSVLVDEVPNSITLTARKTKENVGVVDYQYVYDNGKWKTQLVVTNNSTLANQKFGFSQTLYMNRDLFRFGDRLVNAQDFNGVKLDRTWIVNHESRLIDFFNGHYFDFDLAFDNLESITIFAYSNKTAKLIFDYTNNDDVILPGETLTLDPTFTGTSSFRRAVIGLDPSSACKPTGVLYDTGAQQIKVGQNSDDQDCWAVNYEIDISSLLGAGYFITAVNATIDVDSVSNARNCDIASITTQPTSLANNAANAIMMWNQTRDNTEYVDNNSFCTTGGTDKSLSLGSSAISDLQTAVNTSQSWFAYGLIHNDVTRDASTHLTGFSDARLVVTYTTAPAAPSGLSCSGGINNYSCSWTAVNATDVTGYFIAHSPDNSTWSLSNMTVLGNVTSTVYSGFGDNESNYIRVNATVSNVANSTSSNVVFATTKNIPNAPVNQVGTVLTSTSAKFNWDGGPSDGGDTVTNYDLRYELNGSGGWINVVVNGTLPPRNYNLTGLPAAFAVVAQIRELNGVGYSSWSGNATIGLPDPVDDLSSPSLTVSSVDLTWTQPSLNGYSLEGYRINYTTPYGTPSTILVNNTNSSAVAYTVSGLSYATQYSFRVAPWTGAGTNANGNILNVTTEGSTFEVGSLAVNQTNTDIVDFRFVRTDLNETAVQLDVVYPNTFDPACDLYYKFARINQTYNNLTQTTYSSGFDYSRFTFYNVTNEIIDVDCWDQNNLASDGRYEITWSQFPLQDQVEDFRSGTYGTMGMFGVVDLITLFIVIISMIGFNRVNETVGAVFTIMILGALSYFEIIILPSLIFGALAIIIVFTVASTRKD